MNERFNEALQRFRIYPLSYEALQRFIEALSNLTRPIINGRNVGRRMVVARSNCSCNQLLSVTAASVSSGYNAQLMLVQLQQLQCISRLATLDR